MPLIKSITGNYLKSTVELNVFYYVVHMLKMNADAILNLTLYYVISTYMDNVDL